MRKFYEMRQKDLPIYNHDFGYPMGKIKTMFEILKEKGKLQEEFRAKDLNQEDKAWFAGSTLRMLVYLDILKRVDTREEIVEITDQNQDASFFDQNGNRILEYRLRYLPNDTLITVKRPTRRIRSTYDVYKLVHNSYDDFLSKMFTRFVQLTESLD